VIVAIDSALASESVGRVTMDIRLA
jgi:hypothetical protein